MPRSTKSRQLAAQKAAAAEPVTIDERATEEEREAYEEMLAVRAAHPSGWRSTDDTGLDEAALTEELDAAAEVNEPEPEGVDLNELSQEEIDKLHARDFDWDTMRWSPAKITNGGSRPCLCNRIQGGECDLTTKSRFSIGHDARFKSILQKAWREGKLVPFSFVPEDNAVATDAEGNDVRLTGEVQMPADMIAALVAPKLVKHIVHQSRAAQLQKLDAEAGTTVPQTAVEHKPDEELTDADVEAQPSDTADAAFREES